MFKEIKYKKLTFKFELEHYLGLNGYHLTIYNCEVYEDEDYVDTYRGDSLCSLNNSMLNDLLMYGYIKESEWFKIDDIIDKEFHK